MAGQNIHSESPGADISMCRIFTQPVAFVDKTNEPLLIMPLHPSRHDSFRRMFFEEMPRTSLNGVPPLKDEACNAWLNSILATGTHLVVIAFDGRIVGHAGLFAMKPGVWEILINMLPAFRNRGIGTRLTRAAVELAYQAGVEQIWLSVDSSNIVARHVYSKCGFEYLGSENTGDLYMALGLVQQRNAEKIAVRSLINRDVIFIREDATCENAIRLFVAHPIGALPVVDAAHSVVGILSETDLLVETNFKKRVAEIMTTDVISIQEDFSVARVVRLFRSRNLRVFPVVSEKNRLIGVIGRKDILKYYMNYAELRYVV